MDSWVCLLERWVERAWVKHIVPDSLLGLGSGEHRWSCSFLSSCGFSLVERQTWVPILPPSPGSEKVVSLFRASVICIVETIRIHTSKISMRIKYELCLESFQHREHTWGMTDICNSLIYYLYDLSEVSCSLETLSAVIALASDAGDHFMLS